jgi:hypothetical protein
VVESVIVENWNSANGFIFYGRGAELASNRREDQETSALALHLLQASLRFLTEHIFCLELQQLPSGESTACEICIQAANGRQAV